MSTALIIQRKGSSIFTEPSVSCKIEWWKFDRLAIFSHSHTIDYITKLCKVYIHSLQKMLLLLKLIEICFPVWVVSYSLLYSIYNIIVLVIYDNNVYLQRNIEDDICVVEPLQSNTLNCRHPCNKGTLKCKYTPEIRTLLDH